jgi:hypothetical protein
MINYLNFKTLRHLLKVIIYIEFIIKELNSLIYQYYKLINIKE